MNRHKISQVAFTRTRKLTFIVMFTLLIRKSVKSIQLLLNEFLLDTHQHFSITAGAFTKARKKFKHTAFIELNELLIDIYYRDNDVKRFRGLRLLAFDGSKIILPNNCEIKDAFGSRTIGNSTGYDIGDYTQSTYQACYDVLNNIVVQSELGPCDIYEPDMAIAMINGLDENDLSIFDRGYASYSLLAHFLNNRKLFLVRCPRSSFREVREMFHEDAPESRVVNINAPLKHRKKMNQLKLPSTIRLRLIKVILSTGETEVLATSLFDEDKYQPDDFQHLYNLRWGVETFFSKIKGRLSLENFTGKTVEAVKQDFWSTIFISNFETLMTEDVEEDLNITDINEKKPVKVNKAVSFNAIKKMAFDIFFKNSDKQLVIKKLEQLFRMNTVLVREGRKAPRRKESYIKSFNYQKRGRKHVF